MGTPLKNIALVGFMGTGKSTVGRLLARDLSFHYVDMDRTIEQRTGRTISDIFAQEGESHFRTLEKELAEELSTSEGLIISTGGGIVLNPSNIENLSRTGLVVCLTAEVDTILERVEHSKHRPLLAEGDKRQKIVDLLAKRQHLYEAVPHQVKTDGKSLEQVRDIVLELYRHTAK